MTTNRTRPEPGAVERAAVIGAGTIGASWAALFLSKGLTVAVSDPDPAAEEAVRAAIAKAWPALERLGLAPGADPEAWSFHTDPRDAARGARFVQENAPERDDVKRALYTALEEVLDDEVVVASSTSGLIMSELQRGRRAPGRFVVGHPFNPPHLIPLVEVVGGRDTTAETIEWLTAFYRAVGKRPIRLNREVPGHLANRLQAALWREAVHAVATGLASVEDVDTAIAEGPGLRWAIMGPNMIFNLAGGAGGMPHFLDHIGPAMEGWWRDLGAPALTPEVRDQLTQGMEEALRSRSNAELARERDQLLMALIETLQQERERIRAGHDHS
ncbi:3-hydroxyacyl-CoA dehydrogenase NAD-binding domain-containing protein [Azospirillum soli]|uniref:3-hydroxyacyl-CoA dehydrogenase NAD-binding domain-containing protein n=1 Tax=Azospirillum soli TaxID=1304799 RepID=UPI001AE65E73|nr:3-hydroxyacyl-CoA dehydrogenase NAD-binding domain-containing protein [Azospirillum soli]MBP2314340.1 3-hydroxyacyl-CoA dehydrogenase [Azospirillum soli]